MQTSLRCTVITIHPGKGNGREARNMFTWACKEHNIRSGLTLMSAEAAYNDALIKHRAQI